MTIPWRPAVWLPTCLLVAGLSGCADQSWSARVWMPDQHNPAATLAVEQVLDRRVDRADLHGVPLGEAIQWLRDTGGISIHVRWEAMRTCNIDEKTPVQVSLADVPLGEVLRVILEDVGGVNPLDYIVDEGVLTVSSVDDLSRFTVTRIYDVSDFARSRQLTPGDRLVLKNAFRDALGGPGIPGADPSGTSGQAVRRQVQARLDDLVHAFEDAYRLKGPRQLRAAIVATIAPDTWREEGGSTGSIDLLEDKLVVTNTPLVHRQIVRLLAGLRGMTPSLPGQARPTTPGKPLKAAPRVSATAPGAGQ